MNSCLSRTGQGTSSPARRAKGGAEPGAAGGGLLKGLPLGSALMADREQACLAAGGDGKVPVPAVKGTDSGARHTWNSERQAAQVIRGRNQFWLT